MKIRSLLAAAALSAAPTFGFAQCEDRHQAQSCAPGMVWDSTQKTCVDQANS